MASTYMWRERVKRARARLATLDPKKDRHERARIVTVCHWADQGARHCAPQVYKELSALAGMKGGRSNQVIARYLRKPGTRRV